MPLTEEEKQAIMADMGIRPPEEAKALTQQIEQFEQQQEAERAAEVQAQVSIEQRTPQQQYELAITSDKPFVTSEGTLDLKLAVSQGLTHPSDFPRFEVSQTDIDQTKQELAQEYEDKRTLQDYAIGENSYRLADILRDNNPQIVEAAKRLFAADDISQTREWIANHIRLPDGKWMPTTDFEALPEGAKRDALKLGFNGIDTERMPSLTRFNKFKEWGIIPQDAIYAGKAGENNPSDSESPLYVLPHFPADYFAEAAYKAPEGSFWEKAIQRAGAGAVSSYGPYPGKTEQSYQEWIINEAAIQYQLLQIPFAYTSYYGIYKKQMPAWQIATFYAIDTLGVSAPFWLPQVRQIINEARFGKAGATVRDLTAATTISKDVMQDFSDDAIRAGAKAQKSLAYYLEEAVKQGRIRNIDKYTGLIVPEDIARLREISLPDKTLALKESQIALSRARQILSVDLDKFVTVILKTSPQIDDPLLKVKMQSLPNTLLRTADLIAKDAVALELGGIKPNATLAQLSQDLVKTSGALRNALYNYPEKFDRVRVAELMSRTDEIKARIVAIGTEQASGLYDKYLIAQEHIPVIKQMIADVKATSPDSPAIAELERELRANQKLVSEAPELIAKSLKNMQIVATPPDILSGAGGGIATLPRVIPQTGTGTGSQVTLKPVVPTTTPVIGINIPKSINIERIKPSTVEQVREATQKAIEAGQEAARQAAIRGEPIERIEESVGNEFRQALEQATQSITESAIQLAVQAQTNQITKQATQAIVESAIHPATQTKTGVATQVITPTQTYTPKKPKPIKLLILYGRKPKDKAKRGGKEGIITFKMGKWWVVLEYPYTKGNLKLVKTAPKGAKVVSGLGSAFKTIQKLTGESPDQLLIDYGIMDVIIQKPTTPGKRGTIKFRRDIKQETTYPLTVKGIRAK